MPRHIGSKRPGACLGILFAILLIPMGGCGEQVGESRPAGAGSMAAPDEAPQLVDLAELGFDEGSEETALFGVVEFSDFGCVYCAAFHETAYPTLHEEFVLSGEVLWKYIPITIGGFPNGRLAGLSGICGALLGNFAAMRDRLFETRDEWLASNRGELLFVGYAESVGLDAAAFAACLAGEEARTLLDQNDRMARDIGVSGTPTFIIRGIPVRGAPPLDAFRTALQELVVESREPPPNP